MALLQKLLGDYPVTEGFVGALFLAHLVPMVEASEAVIRQLFGGF